MPPGSLAHARRALRSRCCSSRVDTEHRQPRNALEDVVTGDQFEIQRQGDGSNPAVGSAGEALARLHITYAAADPFPLVGPDSIRSATIRMSSIASTIWRSQRSGPTAG